MAMLKSSMETLVLRCQHTCAVVLPRLRVFPELLPFRGKDVRDPERSSSDSTSDAPDHSGKNIYCILRHIIVLKHATVLLAIVTALLEHLPTYSDSYRRL